MILGLGIELVDPERFRAAARRFGPRLEARLFTPGERRYAARRRRGDERLAVRFAAKSAARRALGEPGVGWREIEVVGEPGRAPTLRFHGRAARAARACGVRHTSLSLSHDGRACLAQVVLEGGP